MLNIKTNNYVESWHNILNTEYLGTSREQRTDFLGDTLLGKVLPDLRLKAARVLIGLECRKLNLSKKSHKEKSDAVNLEFTKILASQGVFHQGENNYSLIFRVNSFTGKILDYVDSLNAASTICQCTCFFLAISASVCKHIYLVQRVHGFSMCFETRTSG